MMWTFGRKLAVGFAVPSVVLLFIALFAYQSTQRLIENDRLVSHSHVVRTELSQILSLIKDAETGQRGYIISGDEDFLAPYRSALGESNTTMTTSEN